MCNLDLCFVAEHSNTWCYNAGVCKHNKRGLSLDIYIYTRHGCNVLYQARKMGGHVLGVSILPLSTILLCILELFRQICIFRFSFYSDG
jgi:hypothetical protein